MFAGMSSPTPAELGFLDRTMKIVGWRCDLRRRQDQMRKRAGTRWSNHLEVKVRVVPESTGSNQEVCLDRVTLVEFGRGRHSPRLLGRFYRSSSISAHDITFHTRVPHL